MLCCSPLLSEGVTHINPRSSGGSKTMRPSERHERILQRVTESGRVDIDVLSAELGVSAMTTRRDLALLEADGRSGDVLVAPPGSAAGATSRRSRCVRSCTCRPNSRHVDDRRVGGRRADHHPGHGDDQDGYRRAPRRPARDCMHAVHPGGRALVSSGSVRLMVTGGMVRPGEQSLIGSAATRMLEDYHFDLYIMTASGVEVEQGFTE